MDEARRTVIERWVAKADNDLVTARTMLKHDPPVTDTVCFHSQQCAEKMLKAFLVRVDVHVEKTHDLVRLLKACADHDHALCALTEVAETLSPYAVEIRYADDWRDISVDEARQAVAAAEQFVALMLPRLDL